MNKKYEKTLPISWESWDDAGGFAIQFYEVEFLDNFGEFKKGEKVGCLFLCPLEGYLCAYDEEGEEIKKTNIKFVVV
jgi:hypothetical protein